MVQRRLRKGVILAKMWYIFFWPALGHEQSKRIVTISPMLETPVGDVAQVRELVDTLSVGHTRNPM